MRYRFAPPRFAPLRLAPPSRADGTLAPAAFVAALAMLALAQLMLTDAVELPAVGPVGAGAPLPPLTDPGSRGIPPAILRRPIFAPVGAAASGADGTAAADPLGGVAIAGSIGVGRARFAIVEGPGKAVRRVGVGGIIAGWRLAALTDEAAILTRGSERLTRPFGSAPTGSGQSEQPEEASDDGGPQ